MIDTVKAMSISIA